jgi:hypothetical protein
VRVRAGPIAAFRGVASALMRTFVLAPMAAVHACIRSVGEVMVAGSVRGRVWEASPPTVETVQVAPVREAEPARGVPPGPPDAHAVAPLIFRDNPPTTPLMVVPTPGRLIRFSETPPDPPPLTLQGAEELPPLKLAPLESAPAQAYDDPSVLASATCAAALTVRKESAPGMARVGWTTVGLLEFVPSLVAVVAGEVTV